MLVRVLEYQKVSMLLKSKRSSVLISPVLIDSHQETNLGHHV